MKHQKDEIVTSSDVYVPPGRQNSEVVPPDTNGVLTIGLSFKEIPVKLLLPDPANPKKEIEWDCIIRQLSGKQRDEYLQMIRNRSKTSPDGKNLIVQDLRQLEATLLHWSFFRVEEVEGGRKLHQFKIAEIDSWPDEARDTLYLESCKLSKIGDEGKKKDTKEADQGNE